ncbi:uncharacterized protein Dwil_GK20121 [Drosophila willistoni]|uniref:Right handed beta helix domain-containing protein n=1 Tax=Drosophila willistoni TaxID=7260 RepID=B4MTB3_DROWI|nr:uncharacterized protein Dwil_GK20121 [Drosophila willistoni]
MLPALVIFGLLLAAIPASALGQQPRYNNNRFDTESASQSLIQGNPINICEYCQCEKTTIVCDFQKTKKPLSSIWNSAIAVPPNYTAIQVILTRDTKLELHDGFFQVKNRVNRVIIIGGGQVEITPFAFRNNQGGYPDIQILNVSNVFLKEHSFSGREFKLTVEESAILCTNSTVNLYIEEAQMREIQSFEVVMNKINITKSTIGTILTKAFDVTNINELSFENCRIRKIETNALTNRLFSNHVSITDCHIDAIDKEAISGSGITELTLKNNTIETIESEALKVHSTLVFIQDNTVMHSGNDWLMVTDGQQIVVENNHFKDSGQVSLGHSKNPLNCSFANNRLDSAKSIILNITNCVVRYITTARSCNCNSSDVATSFDHDFSSEIYCTLDARDQSCFNASSVNSRRYSNEACGTMLPNRTMRCTDGSVRIHRKGYGFITKEENAQINRGMPISHIVGIVFGVLTVLLVPICIAYCCLRKLCNRKGCERTDKAKYCFKSQSELSELKSGVANLPDNSSLRKKCERLMANNGKQTIAECSKHITKLISQTNDIPHDINLCLERHLKNHNLNNTLSSHIEAYGGGGGVGGVLGGDDVMTAIGNNSSQPAPSAPILQNELLGDNPIYEELQETQGPQQPLLYGIYSEPLESGSVAPVYSEPFNAADANDMPPPYQAEYATPMRHHHHQVPQSSTLSIQQQQQQQIPSSHTFNNTINHNNNINNNNNARYATPVWRSAASATPTATATTTMPFMASPPITHAQRHVRDLRQDLEAKPQFHPNQLTSIRNQRQLHLTQVGPTATTSTTPTPVTATIRHPQQLQLQRNPRQQLSNSSSRNSFECLDGAASLAAMEHMDMRGAAGGCDTGSDHSGGSDETVKIDDVIQYADA